MCATCLLVVDRLVVTLQAVQLGLQRGLPLQMLDQLVPALLDQSHQSLLLSFLLLNLNLALGLDLNNRLQLLSHLQS